MLPVPCASTPDSPSSPGHPPPLQVTTRVNHASNTSTLAPALGESWGHACNVQLMLQWADGEREARLYKGAAPGVARFQVRRAPGAHRTRCTAAAAAISRAGEPWPLTAYAFAPLSQVTAQGVRGVAQRAATKRSAAEAGADEEE